MAFSLWWSLIAEDEFQHNPIGASV